jgi:integrase
VPRSKAVAGRVFQRKGRPGYYVRVRSGGREVTRYAGADRRTATEFAAKLLSERDRRDLLDEVSIPSVTLADIEADLLAHLEARHAPSTVAAERIRLRQMVEWFGDQALRDLGAAQIQDYVTVLKTRQGLSTASCNRTLALLSVVFTYAVERGLAALNPVRGLARAKEDKLSVPFIGDKDILRLEAACRDEEMRVLIRLLADSGLRRGEALALLWQDVDLRRKAVVVRGSKNHDVREVPLTGAVVAALSEQTARCPPIPLHKPTPVFAELRALNQASVTGRFKTVARRAGFPTMRLHDLRHAFCSRLAQRGTPLPTIAQLAGHRSLQTTQRYAEHLPEGATRQAIDGLERAPREPSPVHDGGPDGGPSESGVRKFGT